MSALTKICLAAIVSFSASAVAQTTSAQIPKLQNQGDFAKEQIKGGETKTVLVALSAGQFATVRTEQHGSILLTSLFDPQGKEIIRMDYPAGGYGPIYISTIASVKGDYRLEVLSKDKWANPANFEVVLDELRSPQAEDQTVIDAQQAFAEGGKSYLAGPAADALPHYLRALDLWTKAKNERWQALTHFALNQTYFSIGARERSKAIKELESLLAIVNVRLPPNDWRLKAAALNDLGSHYTFTSEITKGIDYLKEALDLFLSHQDRLGQASALNNLAIAHGRTGNFSLARDLIQRALPLRYLENDQARAINLMNSLGGVSDRLGEPDKALEYFEQALQEYQKLGTLTPRDQARVALVLQNLAVASDKLGQWGKAREYYDRALAMLSEGDPTRVAALDSRGELYASLGEPEKARASYDEALALLPAEKFDPDLKAGILVHIGQLFSLQGDLANAVSSFEQARNLKPQRPKLADVLTNLAVALASQGKLEEAMAAYNEAYKIQVELKDKRGQALTLQKRGETYNLLKKHALALDDLKRSLSLWEELKDPRGRAATLNTLAEVEDASGNLRDALKYSDDVIAIVESQRTTLISSRQLRISYFATQESYYELNIDLNMRLSKSGGVQYVAQAFATAEKVRARVLLETLMEAGVDRARNDKFSNPQQSHLLEQLRTFKSLLAAKAQARTRLLNGAPNSTQIAKLDQEIDYLSEKCDSLEAQVRSHHPRFANLTKPQLATLQETQQQLDEDTVLLEYSIGNNRSYAWVITRESVSGQKSIKGFELPPRVQIETAAGRLKEALTDSSPNNNETIPQQKLRQEKAFSEASAELSKLVLEQVAPALDRKRLLVVPDGALQWVSFGALPLPGTATSVPLIAQHEIVYLSSASVLALQRRELANRKPAPYAVAILANPVFGPDDYRVTSVRNKKTPPVEETLNTTQSNVEVTKGATRSNRYKDAMRDAEIDRLSPLPYSYDEAIAIMNVAPKGGVFAALGFEANRSAAMNPKLSQYRIIHFATHGVLNLKRPELSAMVFSLVDKNGLPQDGSLFLDDVYNLNLPAELVVLSACQTGVGKQVKGEGLIALTRGFMYAGAARVVASLWKVDDAATAALMKQLYKEMFINNKTPAAALRAAQLHLREQRRWSSPAHWAGFFIQGEWK